jgi:hypothetical protein
MKCQKTFNSRHNLKKHVKKCKLKHIYANETQIDDFECKSLNMKENFENILKQNSELQRKLDEANSKMSSLINEKETEKMIYKNELVEMRSKHQQHIRTHNIEVTHQDNHSKFSSVKSSFRCESTFHNSLSKTLNEFRSNLSLNANCNDCKEFLDNYQLKDELQISPNDFIDTKTNIYAKNIYFNYANNQLLNKETVFESIKTKFPEAQVTMDQYDETETAVSLMSNKRIRIRSLNNFKLNGINPIIRKFTYEERARLGKDIKNIPHDQILSDLKSFLNEPNKHICKNFSESLKNIILNVNILVHSEYVIASIFFYLLLELGQSTLWQNLRIFSLDSKMEIYLINDCGEDKANPFRCDLILTYFKYLFIFEHKYRHDRKSSQTNLAMSCIEKKQYVKRVCYFLQNNEEYAKMLDKITHVISVGVGYSVFHDKEVYCGIKYEKEEISQYLNLAEIDLVVSK